MAAAPKPFTVSVPQAQLDYLQERLAAARLPGQLQDIGEWEDGTSLPYFKSLLDYWATQYDWRKWEREALNKHRQYTLPVNGIDLHFIHEPSDNPGAIPLLLLHGWPGSYFEFYKLIPLLKATGRYHIVAPSLPGYGFSSAPTHRGFGVTKIAATVDGLMGALGYSRYIAQGGDWGSIVCRALAKYHTSSCAAIHINMCPCRPSFTNPWHIAQLLNTFLAPRLPLLISSTDMQRIGALRRFQSQGTGYQKIQGTKPQTLAYALHDSPVGLAAWILEKFQGWSDCGGGDADPDAAISKDEMLTNICIYQFSGCIASSIRLYKETLAKKQEMAALFSGFSSTPTGIADFPAELYRPVRSWAAGLFNIVQYNEQPKGGHFAALEQPQLLFEDVQAFVDRLEKKQLWPPAASR